MNHRAQLLLSASIVISALACAACGSGPQDLQAAVPQETPQHLLADAAAPDNAAKSGRRAFTPVVEPADDEGFGVESIYEDDVKQGRRIDFAFPVLRGRRADKFNRAVRALAQGVVGEFKRSHPGAGARRDGLSDWLRGSYQTTHFAGELIGLRFSLHSAGWEGRRVQSFRVLNFDLESGEALALGDLFRPEAKYLEAVAAYCVADLKRQAAEEHRREVARLTQLGKPASQAGVPADALIESGASAEADNYRAWNLTAEGVLVSFAACQVDSCAADEKEVLVPYSALAGVLKQDGPAARLAARLPRS